MFQVPSGAIALFVALVLSGALFPSALLPCSPHGSPGGTTFAVSLPQHTHPSVLLLHHSAGFQVQVPSPLLFAAALPFEDFSPFGPGAGDSQLAHADDDTSAGVEMPGLRILGIRSDFAYPDINGQIGFQNPRDFQARPTYPPFRNIPGPVIAAMWFDVDTRNRAIGTTPGFPEENNVFYRRENSTNATAIYNVLADRFTELGRPFVPSAALIVTWWKVGSFGLWGRDNSAPTSAQAVILHNDQQTFIILRLNGSQPSGAVGVGIDTGRQLESPNYCHMTVDNLHFDSTVCDAALFPHFAASPGHSEQHLKQTPTARPGEFIFALTRPPTATETPTSSRIETPTSSNTRTATARPTQTRSHARSSSDTKTPSARPTRTSSSTLPSSTRDRSFTPSRSLRSVPTPSAALSTTGTFTKPNQGTSTLTSTLSVRPEKQTATRTSSVTRTVNSDLLSGLGTMTISATRTVKKEPLSGLGRRADQLTPAEVAGIATGASLLFLLLLVAFVVAFIIFIVYRRRKDKKDPQSSDIETATVDTTDCAPPVVVIGDGAECAAPKEKEVAAVPEIVTGTVCAPTEPLSPDPAPVPVKTNPVVKKPAVKKTVVKKAATRTAAPPKAAADTRRRGGQQK